MHSTANSEVFQIKWCPRRCPSLSQLLENQLPTDRQGAATSGAIPVPPNRCPRHVVARSSFLFGSNSSGHVGRAHASVEVSVIELRGTSFGGATIFCQKLHRLTRTPELQYRIQSLHTMFFWCCSRDVSSINHLFTLYYVAQSNTCDLQRSLVPKLRNEFAALGSC